jgi:AP-2 complex subunit alpha
VGEVELQQRSVEYFVMTNVAGNPARLAAVMDPMPDFPERASALEKTVEEGMGESADAAAGKVVRLAGGVLAAPPPRPGAAAATSSAPPPPQIIATVSSVPTMGLEDLLGGGLAQPAAAPAAAPTAFPSDRGLEDLLGGGGPQAPQAPASSPALAAAGTAASTVAIAPTVSIAECLKKLQTVDNGLVYEDPYIQIGVKSQWQGNQGRVMFYLGNKHNADLAAFAMELTPVSGLSSRLAAVPPVLGAKKQVQVLLELAAVSGFSGAPTLTLRYTVAGAGAVNQCLTLPYGAHKFLQPWHVANPQEFFTQWHEVTKAAQDVKVVTVAAGVAAGGLPAMEAALASIKLSVHKALDPNTSNVVAGSKISYSAAGETFALVRCESDANNKAVYRITVAANDMETVMGIQAALFSQILP